MLERNFLASLNYAGSALAIEFLHAKGIFINFDAMEKLRKLTPHDLAFGIGRKATKEELEDLFNRLLGKLSTSEELLAELKDRNKKKKIFSPE